MKFNPEQLDKLNQALCESAGLSFVEKRQLRDRLFKKIGEVSPQVMHSRPVFSWGITFLVAIFVFLASITTTAVAENAKPGDFFFGVKKVVEKTALLLTRDPIKAAKFKLQIADDRLAAVEEATPEKVGQVLAETQVALNDASKAVLAVKDDSAPVLLDRLQDLLDAQKSLLDSLEKKSEDSDLKSKIVAVRNELDEIDKQVNPVPAPVAKPAAGPEPAAPVESAPAEITLPIVGRLGTAYGAPALYPDGSAHYYKLEGLEGFGGWESYVGTNITVAGKLEGDNIIVKLLLQGDRIVFTNPEGATSNEEVSIDNM